MKTVVLFLFLNIGLFANIGNIMALSGSASVTHSSGKSVKAQSGMKIFQGDKVMTHAKTRVQIMLKDETIVTIGANASFQFDKYFFDGTKRSTVQMRANRGFFRSVTGRMGKIAPDRFKVRTSSATIGIRGTDFSGMIQKTFETYKCYRGAITVTAGGRIKTLRAGEVFKIQSDNAARSASPDMHNVTDAGAAQQGIIKGKPNTPKPPVIPAGTPCRLPK